MTTHTYLIVEAGMAARTAVDGVRRIHRAAPIADVSAEGQPAYRRSLLSKDLWRDPSVSIQVDTGRHIYDLFPEEEGIRIDQAQNTVQSVREERFGCHELLIAAGGRPPTLPELPPGGSVITFRALGVNLAAR